MTYETWRDEARAKSVGCTELSCLYHGETNRAIYEKWTSK